MRGLARVVVLIWVPPTCFAEKKFVWCSGRRATLDALRKDKIFIGRADVLSQHLDGTKRAMANEGELARALIGIGFSVVEAAEYREEEKAYIFELATTVVLPVGAVRTNGLSKVIIQ